LELIGATGTFRMMLSDPRLLWRMVAGGGAEMFHRDPTDRPRHKSWFRN